VRALALDGFVDQLERRPPEPPLLRAGRAKRPASLPAPESRMAKKTHTDQHFVPACYLKAWLEDDIPKGSTKPAFVWIFDQEGKNPQRKSPRRIFTETDLYTLRGADGARDLRLEHGLGEIEDGFTRVRNSKLNRRRELNTADWKWLCLFVATAYMRTKSMIDHHVGQWQKVFDMVERVTDQVDADRVSGIERTYPPTLRSGPSYTPQPGDFERMKASTPKLLVSQSIETVFPVLERMHFTIFCTDDPVGFVTSDTPCIWHDSTAYRRPPVMRGVGLMDKDIEITMPLSPWQCIVFTHMPISKPGYTDCQLGLVDSVNARQIGYAHESFVCRSPIARPEWFARQPLPVDAWENTQTPNGWTAPGWSFDSDGRPQKNDPA
jgi:Protein of unknown function (DUF4238)